MFPRRIVIRIATLLLLIVLFAGTVESANVRQSRSGDLRVLGSNDHSLFEEFSIIGVDSDTLEVVINNMNLGTFFNVRSLHIATGNGKSKTTLDTVSIANSVVFRGGIDDDEIYFAETQTHSSTQATAYGSGSVNIGKNLTVITGSGNDTIESVSGHLWAHNLTFNTGKGDDKINVFPGKAERFSINTGAGNDTVSTGFLTITNSQPAVDSGINRSIIVNLGSGNDSLVYKGGSNVVTRLLGSSGKDYIELINSSIGSPLIVSAGTGNDTVGIGQVQQLRTIACGSGQDTIQRSALETPSLLPVSSRLLSCERIFPDENPPIDEPEPPQNETALRVMAVGDSITHGVPRELATSYRKAFTERLTAENCSYLMVGSQTTNYRHSTFVSAHEGYNGHEANHFLTGHTSNAGQNNGIYEALDGYKPNLVLLHIGTNDINRGQDIDETLAEVDQIISAILNADADVLIANIIPLYREATASRIQTYGDRIEAYITSLGNNRVKLVDVRKHFTPAMMLLDNVHPNSTGDAHIADAFYDVFMAGGYCQR